MKIGYLLKPHFTPIYAPPRPPVPLGENFFFSNQSLIIWLDSIRMNYLPRMLQKLRKMKKCWSLLGGYLGFAQILHLIVFLTKVNKRSWRTFSQGFKRTLSEFDAKRTRSQNEKQNRTKSRKTFFAKDISYTLHILKTSFRRNESTSRK